MTKSGNRGIIKTNKELFSKKRNAVDNSRVPISRKRFDELTIEVRKMGATVIQCDYGDEMFNHLQSNNATASCIGNTLLFRPDVTISEVLEETFHFKQNLSKVNDDKPVKLRTILNEIEAKEYILNNSKKYNIPRTEIEETKFHLQKYKNELNDYYDEV